MTLEEEEKAFEAWYQSKKRQTIARSDRQWALLGWLKGREETAELRAEISILQGRKNPG